MARILIDTSAIYAMFQPKEPHHQLTLRLLKQMSQQNVEPILTNYIVAETHALLNNRVSSQIAHQWLIQLNWPVIHMTEEDAQTVKSFLQQYFDHDYSYTDCHSFIAMKQLGIHTAFAYDRHFEEQGFSLLHKSGLFEV